MGKSKYGIAKNTMGVYYVRNKSSGELYVGASVRIAARLSNHFNRDARRYKHRKFYSDILKLGVNGFE